MCMKYICLVDIHTTHPSYFFFFINPYSKFKDLDAVETKLSKFQMPKCITLKKLMLMKTRKTSCSKIEKQWNNKVFY